MQLKPSDLIKWTGWSRGAMARDRHGKPCFMYSSDVASFCTSGAIWYCYRNVPDFCRAGLKVTDMVGSSLSDYDDRVTKGKREVIAMLRSVGE